MHILDKMQAAMGEAKTEVSDFAPKLFTMKINPEKIRDVIGKGGAVIRALTEETGCQINIEEDGTITIATCDRVLAEGDLDGAIANVTIAQGPGTFPGVGFVSAAGSLPMWHHLHCSRSLGMRRPHGGSRWLRSLRTGPQPMRCRISRGQRRWGRRLSRPS